MNIKYISYIYKMLINLKNVNSIKIAMYTSKSYMSTVFAN